MDRACVAILVVVVALAYVVVRVVVAWATHGSRLGGEFPNVCVVAVIAGVVDQERTWRGWLASGRGTVSWRSLAYQK